MRRRILVIEDDPDVRRLITDSLRDAGLEVIPAVDGLHALRSAIAVQPAAVVLDLGLPEMQGADFVTHWRERSPTASDVPIVVVSGRRDAREIATLIGAVRVFGKPFVVEELVGEVERAALN